MSNRLLIAIAFLFVLLLAAPATYAQGGVRTGPDPSTLRDPDLERDSLHNLEVARNYFKLKKAYVAALMRLEEIIAGNPNFTRIEEVLLMAGQSSIWLAENKGKQPSSLYVSVEDGKKRTLTPEQFRELGREYLTRLVKDYPDGPYSKQAREELTALEATGRSANSKQ
ncbi:MAG TPA: outer membrane protein assembly factor BamD [Pyrinomonadaceae bacterium]|nr:outer membrane protein assembly factor BamD [Pyrinomonadaceae bacterium]